MAKKPKTTDETSAPDAASIDLDTMMAKIASGAELTEDEAQAHAEHEARQAAIANGTDQEG